MSFMNSVVVHYQRSRITGDEKGDIRSTKLGDEKCLQRFCWETDGRIPFERWGGGGGGSWNAEFKRSRKRRLKVRSG
jgi:hypothetical protein